jgi:hypothetical protein
MNLKLHVIAVTFFVLLGMVVLVTTGKIGFGEPPAAPAGAAAEKEPEGFVQVDSASWGLNCERFAASLPPFKPTKEDPTPPIAIRRDNVIRVISSLCNGKAGCEIPITPEVLGKDPIPSCTKELRVEYRCHELDLVRRETFYATARKPAILDCREKSRGAIPGMPAGGK